MAEAHRRALHVYPEFRRALAIGKARRALNELTKDELRITAFLHHLGMSYGQLADVLGVNERTVEERVARWRAMALPND